MNKTIILTLILLLNCLLVYSGNYNQNYSTNVKVRKSDHKRAREVEIDRLPHISQRKSNCVPASCAMILRYFDERTNQKDLAKLFKTTNRGTSYSNMISAFYDPELQDFKITELYTLTGSEAAQIRQAYEKAINNLSKKEKKAIKKTKRKKRGLDTQNLFTDMQPVIARKVLAECRVGLRQKMQYCVQQYINAGVPILWSVTMHLAPDSDSSNNHMRIINGYVIKNQQITHILYRDSWRGHSNGRIMPFDTALAMTWSLFVILPKQLDIKKMPRIKLQ